MTDYGYYLGIEHISSEYPAEKDTAQTNQDLSGLGEDPMKHVEKEFKDFFCPFCDYGSSGEVSGIIKWSAINALKTVPIS